MDGFRFVVDLRAVVDFFAGGDFLAVVFFRALAWALACGFLVDLFAVALDPLRSVVAGRRAR